MTFPLWWNKPKPCLRASSRQQVLLTPGLTPPHRSCGPEPVDSPPGAIAVARRTEALARVHAEPRIAIRKVARRLATIAHDTNRTSNMADAKTRRWLSAPLPEPGWNLTNDTATNPQPPAGMRTRAPSARGKATEPAPKAVRPGDCSPGRSENQLAKPTDTGACS
jgi:hypothetical protein